MTSFAAVLSVPGRFFSCHGKMRGGVFLSVLMISFCVCPHWVRGDCTKTGPCSCEDSNGVIDLSPLDGGSSAPKYKDQLPQMDPGYLYSWNPCSPFTELGDLCKSVSGCQVSKDQSIAYPIGTQDSAAFVTDTTTGDLNLQYSAPDGSGGSRYKDQLPQMDPGYLYSWNPCSPFTELGDLCKSVSGCQVSKDQSIAYPIGTQDSAAFVTDTTTGDLNLQYSAPDGSGGSRSLSVSLLCDPTNDPGTLTVVGETTSGHYAMSMNSIHCCHRSGPAPGPGGSSASISIGSIMVIAFFSLVVVYAAAGFSIQKFARKASGKEVIPNYSLWSALPGLIKDGMVFTFTCGRRSEYDKV